MTRIVRVGAAIGAIALIAAGCSGSTKKADPAADLATAKAAILTKADLAGYQSTPHTSSSDVPDSVKKPFATCMKSTVTAFDDVKGAQKVDSADFTKGGLTANEINISAEIKIDPHQSDAKKNFSLMSEDGAEGCIATLLFTGLNSSAGTGSEVKYGKPVVTRQKLQGIDNAVDYLAKISFTGPKGAEVAYVDLVFARRDRAEVMLSAFDASAPFDHATTVALTKKMIDRLGTKSA